MLFRLFSNQLDGVFRPILCSALQQQPTKWKAELLQMVSDVFRIYFRFLGKGPSIWDLWTPLPGSTEDNSTGEIACDSYDKYAQDIANVKSMGVDRSFMFLWFFFYLTHYRFSISWPRILPYGTVEQPNWKGVEYYDKLINLTIANGIEPIVRAF